MNNSLALRKWFTIMALLVGLAGCASLGAQESTSEYWDDSLITAKVKSAFVGDKEVSALHIGVETFKGVVHLSGEAKSKQELNHAVELARNVKGVKSVKSTIQLKKSA